MKNLHVALHSTTTSESSSSKYTFKRPFPQCFSLSFPIIKYMIRNLQSGKVWKKFILLCKYFYSKYPVYPVKDLEVRDWGCKADEEIFDSSKPFPKLWVYEYFSVGLCLGISTIITKIFKFDLRYLRIVQHSLTFEDYRKLTSSGSVEKLDLVHFTIKNPDGSIVTADKLIENLIHLKMVRMMCPNPLTFQPDAIKKLGQHFNRFENMRFFELWGIEETFDFSSFVDFLMKNETIHIFLIFSSAPVSAAYKNMVENVVEEINKNPLLKVPNIAI